MAEILELFPSGMTPKTELVGFYMTVVYVLLIGFCVLLITARNPATKVSVCLFKNSVRSNLVQDLLGNPCERCRPPTRSDQLAYDSLGGTLGSATFYTIHNCPGYRSHSSWMDRILFGLVHSWRTLDTTTRQAVYSLANEVMVYHNPHLALPSKLVHRIGVELPVYS
jgi:hypothetical protein